MIAVTSSSGFYGVIWILVGIVTLFGSGGAYGLYRAAKKQGVRDDKIDRMLLKVLGDENNGGAGGYDKRFDAQDRKLLDIEREAKPNGGNTMRLGDTALRTEKIVGQIKTQLDQHIGQSNEIHEELRRQIADRSSA